MSVPPIDRLLGMEVYATKSQGIGGVIKNSVEDFRVEEELIDGSKADIDFLSKNSVLRTTASRQRYLICELVKKGWDTLLAVRKIAIELGIDQERINIAGIKDAKAVTAQFISMENVIIEDLSKIKLNDLKLNPIGYLHEPLSTYYLLGNNFKISIKELNLERNQVEDRINQAKAEILKVGGIPNFFGHQRFGTIRPITHLVGKAIIKGNLEEAAMLFLAKPSPNEHPDSQKVRKELQNSQNFGKALEDFPRQLRYEIIMLKHLNENPHDFEGAFRRLPEKLRRLFVHAYQSFLFNRFLSERLKVGGSLIKAEKDDSVVNVERSGLPITRSGKTVDSSNILEINDALASGKLRIALPLFGFKGNLQKGELEPTQRRIIEEEGVTAQDFQVNSLRETRVRGELRPVISPIKNIQSSVLSEASGNLKAVLEFKLLRGSYATVLLREIIKPEHPINSGF